MDPYALNIPKPQGGRAEIGMAPLIDIVFLLLIFFMVTTVFPEHHGLEIEKPESEHTAMLHKDQIVVALDKTGGIYYKDQQVTLEDLKRLLQDLLPANQDCLVLIQADRRATTESLIKVMDASKTSGAKKIGIATNEKATLH